LLLNPEHSKKINSFVEAAAAAYRLQKVI